MGNCVIRADIPGFDVPAITFNVVIESSFGRSCFLFASFDEFNIFKCFDTLGHGACIMLKFSDSKFYHKITNLINERTK